MGRCRLEDDHARIRDLLVRIEGGEASVADLAATLERHLAFEEQEVLPLLTSRLPSATGPVRTIQEDHEAIRALLGELGGADPSAPLERLTALLRAHLQMEEELILPFAHAHFCAEDLGRLGCASHGTSQGATS